MKLYLVKRTDDVGLEEIESMVIAAENAEIATHTHPDGSEYRLVGGKWYLHHNGEDIKILTWASSHFLVATEIGETDKYDKTTVIHVSWTES